MSKPVIVVHYHELWLKGGNRNFFLGKFLLALRRSLAQFPVEHIRRPGDRLVIELAEGAPVEEVVARLERVLGIAYFAVARPLARGSSDDMDVLCREAWAEVEPLQFSNFAVRAKRSDKSFPARVGEIEQRVGRYLLDRLRAAGRDVRVQLNDPELTCRIEITPGPMLVYARKIPGVGGLAAEYRGAHGLPALGRIRFGSGGLQDDAARGAPDLCAFLGRRGAARGVVRTRSASASRAVGALPAHREALFGSV